MLISAHQLSKTYGARPLFSNLTFAIDEKERIGLIGPNGAGKSTLLRILMSQTESSEGKIAFKQGLKIACLEQTPQFKPDATLFSTVLEGTLDPDDWEAQSLARKFISQLGLNVFDENIKIQTLSGGSKKRVALARELVKNPDLLLLDEPTNHLDVESILWLENFLQSAPFALLTITHDRLFLQRVANRIIELDPRHKGGMLSVQGDYVKYLEVREQIILAQENREQVLKNTLRRETQWLRQGAKARTTKQQARIKNAQTLQEDVEELSIRNQSRIARLQFVASEKNPKKLIEAKQLSKTYGNTPLFTNLDLLLTPGSRLGILGHNGAGKSTLIRTLLGKEPPTSGTLMQTDHLKVAYFDQIREALDPEQTLSQTLCANGDHVEFNGKFVHIKSYLDRFLFSANQADMKVARLSGGEQSRLLIAKLMLTSANVLVLDEPTNDLDMATLNVLEQCLNDFSGAIILVTHDRYFLDQVANTLLAFPPKGSTQTQLTFFADFNQWEAWVLEQEALKTERERKIKKQPQETEQKKIKLTFTEQFELAEMEKKIQDKEKKLNLAIEESLLPENTSDPKKLTELTTTIAHLQTHIEALYARWEVLENKNK